MRTMMLGLAIALSCAVGAQTMQGPVMQKGGPDAAARARLKAGMHARMGGPVNRPDREPGICFLNAQKTVPASAFEQNIQYAREEFRISCYLREGKFVDLKDLMAQAAATNNACLVCIVDVPGYPQLLTAPDNRWSLVNLAPLKADQPSAGKLAERAAKMAWRGFGLAMGAGFSVQAGGFLQPAETLAELDAIYGRAVPPDCHFPIQQHCELRGVAPGGKAPYRTACKEGWAPAPKDEIQKKIWDEFHK